jgi:hypothetical protein
MSAITSFLNDTVNGAIGTAQTKEGTTISTFIISLASGFVLFTVQFSAYLLVRNYLWAKRIYQPRSFLVPVKQRIKPPPPNPVKWIATLFSIKEDPEVLQKAGMDAYFFLRYLGMCLKIFVPLAIIVIPILIPLNYSHGKANNTINGVEYHVVGLDTLAWSNISPLNTNRYWAHLFLAILVVVWVCFIFYQELNHYIIKRGQYLSSLGHSMKASSRTVLIQDIPDNICNEEALDNIYGDFPGGIRRIWINRDFTKLVNKDKIRRKYEDMLENAETDMLRKAMKQSGKTEIHREASPIQEEESILPGTNGISNTDADQPKSDIEIQTACQKDLEHDMKTKAVWTKYIEPKHRPTMRIPQINHSIAAKLPLVGRFFTVNVDTIYYCRRELARLNKEIDMDTEEPSAYPLNKSAFIQFNSQKAAHLACQSVADIAPSHMRRRIVEISPGDINWPSLNLTWRQRYARLVGFLAFFFLLVFMFGVISFFTGILSKASSLANSTSWLQWINTLPSWLLSFIQGTLPPLIQVIVLSGPLPILIRLLTNRTRGASTGQEGERSLQLWYFIFLIFELFIIPTISSSLTGIVTQLIHSPASVPNILATNLPTAANYYFSFLIVQALSLSATSILQTIRLFKYYVIG